MCGIYGVARANEPLVRRMMAMAGHRGPHGDDTFQYEDKITLGHNLLAITDTAQNGKQPWTDQAGNALTYNGEIFNYDELCKEYKNSFRPTTQCDTELLFWGLKEVGLKFIEKLDSQHAFAFWNAKEETLALSCDHVGIKPLYYRNTVNGLIFSSELKCILSENDEIDTLAASCFAYTGLNVTRNSFFRDIYRILPGETRVYKNNTLLYERRDIVVGTEEDCFREDDFVEHVQRSVQQQFRGNGNKALLLSGGLDSSIIALHAKEAGEKLNTFTNVIDTNEKLSSQYNSDAKCANLFAKELNCNHHEVIHSKKDWLQYLLPSIRASEEPIYNINIPMYYAMNRYISEKDYIITLSGDMGDEITLGYPSYFDFIKENENKNMSDFDIILSWTKRLKAPPNIPTKYSRNEVVEYLRSDPFKDLKVRTNVGLYQRLDQLGTCWDDYFRRNDRFSMNFSMEGRFPWSSKKLMRHCMNIAPEEKMKGRKEIVTRAYRNRLPKYITEKQKSGWSAPAQEWFRMNKGWVAEETFNFYNKRAQKLRMSQILSLHLKGMFS